MCATSSCAEVHKHQFNREPDVASPAHNDAMVHLRAPCLVFRGECRLRSGYKSRPPAEFRDTVKGRPTVFFGEVSLFLDPEPDSLKE